jgi:hypothetical protein
MSLWIGARSYSLRDLQKLTRILTFVRAPLPNASWRHTHHFHIVDNWLVGIPFSEAQRQPGAGA